MVAVNLASHDSLGFVLAEQPRSIRRFNERPRVDLVVGADERGNLHRVAVDSCETEPMAEFCVSSIMTAQSYDRFGDSLGIGGIPLVGRV